MNNKLSPVQLASVYLSTKEFLISAGYAGEIDWQASVSIEKITESDFLRESAWVVLSSGMREAVVRRKFGPLSSAFLNWVDARTIVGSIHKCCQDALKVYRNPRKIGAIARIMERVAHEGFESIKDGAARRGAEYFRGFPYMGPIKSFHLAKNIGLPVVKADRHLCRMAVTAGYETADHLCRVISDMTGDPVSVVDLVLWRYSTQNNNYLSLFSAGQTTPDC